jgi:phage I-like protein
MTKNNATAIFTATDLAAAKGSRAPDWVELFPAGPEINARDGRSWTLRPEIVVAAFDLNKGPLAIDYEHGQAHLAPQGLPAPAAGWIVTVENRQGAVWGRVEWTPKAAQAIIDREYRFLSPDFDHTPDGLIVRLNGAGLVNRPALVMTALSRVSPEEKEPPMSKAIAVALGLAEDADEKAILSALTARQTEISALCGLLMIDTGSNAQAITAAVTKLQAETQTALAAAQSNTAQAEVATLRTALAALQQKDTDREIDAALDAGISAGKITPASRDTYRAMCSVDGGLDRFRALAATLPVICEPSGLDNTGATTMTGENTASPATVAALARKYQDDQAALGIEVSISEAVVQVERSANK